MSGDGAQARLDVQGLARDGATGALVRLKYTGKVDLTGPIGVILRGEEGAGTTGFGDACEFFFPFFFFSGFGLFFFLLWFFLMRVLSHSFCRAGMLTEMLDSQRGGI